MPGIEPRFAIEDAVFAGAAAGIISGAPSTIISLWRREDALEASLAAGTLLLPREQRRGRLLVAAALVHGTLSLGWALLLAVALPRRATIRWSVIAGMTIAVIDLGVVGRHFERIRMLPSVPQIADHLAYALSVGAVLSARRNRREVPSCAARGGGQCCESPSGPANMSA